MSAAPVRHRLWAKAAQPPRGHLRPTDGERFPWGLRLYVDAPLEIYYGPFDYVNTAARLVIVGITPSKAETVAAFEQVAEARRCDPGGEQLQRLVKQNASFVGLRSNLLAMLDGLDIARHLGLPSSAALFTAEHAGLLHATSVVRYPVLWHGENYTGHRPRLLRSPALRWYLEAVLGSELQAVEDALVVPLGRCVGDALHHLVALGCLDPRRCLFGFPHPSGANGSRVEQYTRAQPALRRAVAEWFAGQG